MKAWRIVTHALCVADRARLVGARARLSIAWALLVLTCGAMSETVVAQDGECGRDLTGASRVESARHTIAWLPVPSPIPVGRHFTIDLVVCSKAGAAAPDRVHVDATMPEHRHGMNYKASVQQSGPGRYRAEGLLFHMPGRWEVVFEVRDAQGTAQARESVVVR